MFRIPHLTTNTNQNFKFYTYLVFLTIAIMISLTFGQNVESTSLSSLAVSSSLWQTNEIIVCWENPSSDDLEERGWVQTAIRETWQKYGNISFIGWQNCATEAKVNQAIRILIADEHPHVKNIGRFLAGYQNGMVLNFSFTEFSASCQLQRESCIKSIAVHEFGHAIGFSHEQNRADMPEWCRADAQGTTGDWYISETADSQSIMNYCSTRPYTEWHLSEGDISSVKALYPNFSASDINPNQWYRIITRITAQCIHVQHADGRRRNALWQWECEYNDAFYFRFEPVLDRVNTYRIKTRYGQCIHVAHGPNTNRREPLWQWECLNQPQFYFQLLRTEDNWYKIRSSSGMCFHVAHGPNTNRREPLWQWECLNQPQFYFYLQPVNP